MHACLYVCMYVWCMNVCMQFDVCNALLCNVCKHVIDVMRACLYAVCAFMYVFPKPVLMFRVLYHVSKIR